MSLASQGSITNFSTNGYTKLPSGLILQWGFGPILNDEGPATITFPISFPHNCLNITLTTTADPSFPKATDTLWQVLTVSNSSANIYYQKIDDIRPSRAYWIAIGY